MITTFAPKPMPYREWEGWRIDVLRIPFKTDDLGNTDAFNSARQAAYGRLKTYWDTNHASVPVAYENRFTVDMAQQADPFIGIEVAWYDGTQVSIEENPVVRYDGAIHLAVFTKDGGGTAAAFGWLGELAQLFKTNRF